MRLAAIDFLSLYNLKWISWFCSHKLKKNTAGLGHFTCKIEVAL